MGINILHFQQTYYSITSLYAFIWDANFQSLAIINLNIIYYHISKCLPMFHCGFSMIKLHNTGWAICHLTISVTQY